MKYEPPTLEVLGTAEELTRGDPNGAAQDGAMWISGTVTTKENT